jgi:creatinine amidohydrolase
VAIAGRAWRFDSLTRDDLCQLASRATVVVPLGSTEQHAHHLPVRTDAAIVTAIAERAVELAAAHEPVLLAPTLPFGFAHHHVPFGGTISLSSTTYLNVLTDIVTTLSLEGFRRIVLLNGHGGNESAARLAADRLGYELQLDVNVAVGSYWALAASFLETVDLPNGLVPGHAGHFETSIMLALSPEAVRLDARAADAESATPLGIPEHAGAHIRRPDLWESSDGRTDDARLADADLGSRILAGIAESVAEFLVQFHRSA